MSVRVTSCGHFHSLLSLLCDSWCLGETRGQKESLTCQLVVAEDQLSDVRQSDCNDRGHQVSTTLRLNSGVCLFMHLTATN